MVMFEVSVQLILFPLQIEMARFDLRQVKVPLQIEMARFDLRQIQGSKDSVNLALLLVGQTGLGILG